MCIFGEPGVGKTPLIGSSQVPTLILRPPTDHTVSIERPNAVQEIVIDDWASMYEAKRYVQQEGWKEFDWVWIDTLPGYQDFGLRDIIQDAIIRKPARAHTRGGEKVIELGPDKGEFGINMNRVIATIQDMCGFAAEGKFNFGIVTHPEDYYHPIKEETLLAPWVQGKGMVKKVCGYMNIIAYLQEVERDGKEPQMQLLTRADGFFGKDQYGAFPELKSGKRGMINPSMAKINEALEAVREPVAPRKESAPKKAVKRVKRVKKG
jgi:hypothetical protein